MKFTSSRDKPNLSATETLQLAAGRLFALQGIDTTLPELQAVAKTLLRLAPPAPVKGSS